MITTRALNQHQNIHGVSLYPCFAELLHVSLDKSDIGLFVAKLPPMILDKLAGSRDLGKRYLVSNMYKCRYELYCTLLCVYLTSWSVISMPVTCPLGPTSLLKAKQSRPDPLPRSKTLQPSSLAGNGRPHPKNLQWGIMAIQGDISFKPFQKKKIILHDCKLICILDIK